MERNPDTQKPLMYNVYIIITSTLIDLIHSCIILFILVNSFSHQQYFCLTSLNLYIVFVIDVGTRIFIYDFIKPHPKTFYVDHPFVYYIVNGQGRVVFAGKLLYL